MDFSELEARVADGSIDTVLACLVDMQGRLMGKRFHAWHFVDSAWQETHCCDYLLATDLNMSTPSGFAATSWQTGYGDHVLKPDLSTLRPVPWLEATAMVLCDVLDHHSMQPVAHSPRAILSVQVERLAALGYDAMMATEIEFFLFENGFDEIRKAGYRDLQPLGRYNQDYHIFQTSKEEHVMRAVRNHLFDAGIPVENSKGEAETGQEEVNIRYAAAMKCAEHHTIAKHAIKEIAWQRGHAVTFMAKWHHDRIGSSSHVHQSLWHDGRNAFHDGSDPLGMSDLMKHWMAGLIRYASDYTCFLAPYVNSYKRFRKGSFAPTRTAWSVDNRTAGFRLCGAGTGAVRTECRIGGADLNPYLALAAMIAAGIRGIEDRLVLAPPLSGNAYEDAGSEIIPTSLGAARTHLLASEMLRAAMGDDVIEHYARAAEVELEAFDAVVTDHETARGFEQA